MIARHLTDLADRADAARTDTGCGVLFGVVRDCGYKILREAERERRAHRTGVGIGTDRTGRPVG